MTDDAIVTAALNKEEVCPTCGRTQFQAGPRAGSFSMNVRCVFCGSTYFMSPPQFGLPAGRTQQEADLFKGPPGTLRELWAKTRQLN